MKAEKVLHEVAPDSKDSLSMICRNLLTEIIFYENELDKDDLTEINEIN